MTSLIIINENFFEMTLGTNSSLYYVVEELKQGNDVAIFDLSQNQLPQKNSNFRTLFLKNSDQYSLNLVEKYQSSNDEIIKLIKSKNFDKFSSLKLSKVADLIVEKSELNLQFKPSDFDKIIQRLEPMKKPFPPQGKEKIDDILYKIKNLFPNKKLHLPIGLNDKILPLKLNDILGYEVATPTFLTNFDDKDLSLKITKAIKKHQEINQTKSKKIVVKPLNSAQSLGVFAIDFSEDGLDLLELKKQNMDQLKQAQIFHIKHDLSDSDLSHSDLMQILQILCFLQTNKAKALYNDGILIQPFIEGVGSGDVRVNVIRDENHKFYAAGYVFRKSLQSDDNFTTCFSGGKAISLPISYLSKIEQENLINKTAQIINILNNSSLQNEYDQVLELGFDFLLVGNAKDILLGEINHHCPALLPISQKLANQT